ncbi:MAG TPA: thiamine phosphate synthase [Candidatus Nanoarchaeia archaeon]|nr:thiamine phosphate synthase [Candidatus Nanoarchaeia archaeon]
MKPSLRDINLYLVTDNTLTRKTIVEDVKDAVRAGVTIVQYREKDKSTKEMVEEALLIKKICEGKAIFLVNDRIDVALAADADGVHLGQDDMPYQAARKILGGKIIGLTAHNVLEAVSAEKLGADYVGVSPIFETATKKDAGIASGLRLIKEVKAATRIPIVAIGGINLDNIDSVINSGADSAAVISAITTKEDVYGECKKFIERFK